VQCGFIEYLATQTVRNDRICTPQVGWCRNAFVLPDATYGPGSKTIVFQEGETGKDDYECGGKYKDWKNRIAAVAIGNPMLAFALSAAFVGPLLKLCGTESGGVHFDGDSSTGKTTLLRAAASVWGFPRRYIRTWNTTAAGLEGVAELYNDNLLPLDEIGQCSAEAIGSVTQINAG
jgi:putative DNA primase/helicase